MLAWTPTSASFASLHAACGSHCVLTCTPSLTSSPPLFFSYHAWLLDVPSPMPSLLPHQSLCTCCVRSLEFSLPQTSSKFTPSLPAGGCSKPYLRCLHWSPYVKSGSQLLSYPLTLLCSSLLPILSLQYICLLMSPQLPYFMREALTDEIESLGDVNSLTQSENGAARPQPPVWLPLLPMLSLLNQAGTSKNSQAPSIARVGLHIQQRQNGQSTVALSYLPAASKSCKLTGIIHLLTRLLSLGNFKPLSLLGLQRGEER